MSTFEVVDLQLPYTYKAVKIYGQSTAIIMPSWVQSIAVHSTGRISGFEGTDLFTDDYFWYLKDDSRGLYHLTEYEHTEIYLGKCEYKGDWRLSKIILPN